MRFIEHPENTFLNLSYVTKATYTPSHEGKPRMRTRDDPAAPPGANQYICDTIPSSLKLEFHKDCGVSGVKLEDLYADEIVAALRGSLRLGLAV